MSQNKNAYNEVKSTNVAPVSKEETVTKASLPESNFDPSLLVEEKKSGLFKRFLYNTIGPDFKGRVRKYVVDEVIIPSIRTTTANSLKSVIDIMFLGGSRGYYESDYNRSVYNHNRQTTNYNSMYRNNEPIGGPADMFEEVEYNLFKTKEGADYVIRQLREELALFGEVRLSSYYRVIRKSQGRPYTDNDFGWTSLDYVSSVPAGRGYYKIDFPPLKSF